MPWLHVSDGAYLTIQDELAFVATTATRERAELAAVALAELDADE